MPEAIVKEAKIYDKCKWELALLNDQCYSDLAKNECHMEKLQFEASICQRNQ